MLSLVSHTIYAWAIGVVFLIMFMAIEQISITRKPLIELFILLLLILIAVLRFQLILIDKVLITYSKAFWGNLSGYLLFIIAWFVIRAVALSKKRQALIDALVPILWLHVSVFVVQFVRYLFTGKYLDFVKPFTGVESRFGSFGETGPRGIGSIRPTGLLVEPSTYSYVVLALTILIILHKGFGKHKILLSLTILTMYLSFSTAAAIVATIFLVFLLLSASLRLKYLLILAVIGGTIGFFAWNALSTFYVKQELKYNYSSGVRFNLLAKITSRDADLAILALGPFAVDKSITFSTTTGTGDKTVASLNDSGIFIFLWLEFGYFGIALFMMLCYFQYRRSRKLLVMFLILSLTKMNPFLPFFVVFYVISLIKPTNNNLLKKPSRKVLLWKRPEPAV